MRPLVYRNEEVDNFCHLSNEPDILSHLQHQSEVSSAFPYKKVKKKRMTLRGTADSKGKCADLLDEMEFKLSNIPKIFSIA